MSKKKKKLNNDAPVSLPSSMLKQLWVVERIDDREKKIYVYAARWFDVREVGGMKLNTNGNYVLLFIRAVMADVDVGDTPVFEVEYNGTAPNMQRRIGQWHNVTPRSNGTS